MQESLYYKCTRAFCLPESGDMTAMRRQSCPRLSRATGGSAVLTYGEHLQMNSISDPAFPFSMLLSDLIAPQPSRASREDYLSNVSFLAIRPHLIVERPVSLVSSFRVHYPRRLSLSVSDPAYSVSMLWLKLVARQPSHARRQTYLPSLFVLIVIVPRPVSLKHLPLHFILGIV